MTTTQRQKPSRLDQGAAFKNRDNDRSHSIPGGYVKQSRVDRRQKRGWTRGRR